MSERKWQKEIQAWLYGDELEYLNCANKWVNISSVISANPRSPMSYPELAWRIKPVSPKDLATGDYLAVNEVFSICQVRNAFRAGWDKAIESIT
jgi:hypothetical protein